MLVFLFFFLPARASYRHLTRANTNAYACSEVLSLDDGTSVDLATGMLPPGVTVSLMLKRLVDVLVDRDSLELCARGLQLVASSNSSSSSSSSNQQERVPREQM